MRNRPTLKCFAGKFDVTLASIEGKINMSGILLIEGLSENFGCQIQFSYAKHSQMLYCRGPAKVGSNFRKNENGGISLIQGFNVNFGSRIQSLKTHSSKSLRCRVLPNNNSTFRTVEICRIS